MKNPGEVRARTCGTKSPSRSEALRFINSSKFPSTEIDGSLVNFRRRLSNRHGRPRRMLIWTFEGNTDETVSTSTWFAQVGSSVLIELGQMGNNDETTRANETDNLRGVRPCDYYKIMAGPSWGYEVYEKWHHFCTCARTCMVVTLDTQNVKRNTPCSVVFKSVTNRLRLKRVLQNGK